MITHIKSGLLGCIFMMVFIGTGLGDDLRVGLIGLDTSHVIAFTRLLNDPSSADHIPGAKVIMGYRGGSPDIPSSIDRVEEYTGQLVRDYGIGIASTIEELCENVDVVMLTSVDGRPHLEQARPVILAGKTLFIDKPLAGSLKDCVAIYQLAAEHKVPVFTSSAYRYYSGLTELLQKDIGEIRSAISYGPAYLEPHHPDLYWYGIHPVEALFTVMGPGCETVSRTHTENTDVVTGIWNDGRVGNLHALRNGKTPHGVMVFGTKDYLVQTKSGNYAPLIREVVQFFKTGKPPVPVNESLEIYAFMEAADESKRQGGKPVSMTRIMELAGWMPESHSGK
ncbi:MAG: Gfo/Idh/MocA family oxidoreductase [Verrucomicrobia bacterium]|nr:Gfo/Idh/MocA family oxidoreductase [Verrucomicrobiota bacterium]